MSDFLQYKGKIELSNELLKFRCIKYEYMSLFDFIIFTEMSFSWQIFYYQILTAAFKFLP